MQKIPCKGAFCKTQMIDVLRQTCADPYLKARFLTHGNRAIFWIQVAVFQAHPIDPKLF